MIQHTDAAIDGTGRALHSLTVSDSPDVPLPGHVQRLVDHLGLLGDTEFREALADNIMEPDPDETAAFQSPQLVARAMQACDDLRANARGVIRRLDEQATSGSDQARAEARARRRRTDHFVYMVGREKKRLELVRRGYQAQEGRVLAAPNPRQRAFEDLARKYPQEYLRLVRAREAELRRTRKARRKRG